MVEQDIVKRKTEVTDYRVRSGYLGWTKFDIMHVEDSMTRKRRSLIRIASVTDPRI